MTSRVLSVLLGVAAVLCLGTASPRAQTPADPETLAQEIEALKEGHRQIRGDLEEIKNLLHGGKAPAPSNPVVSLEGTVFKGDPEAKLTLIEFSDYGCPFCSRHVRETAPQLEVYIAAGTVKHVFHDFPIEALHPQAVKAHEAARCAGDQDRYWEMHDHLFANQTALAPQALVRYAEEQGVADVPAFTECLTGGTHTQAVRRAIAAGQAAGVTGTPTFMLGLTEPGSDTVTAVTTVVWAHPFARFQQAIDSLLDAQQ